jgi:hypothetical protein
MSTHGDNSSTEVVRTSSVFNLISASLAFFLWGGWAWFANAEAAAKIGASPLTFALTQGICSFTITLCMVRSTTRLFYLLAGNPLVLLLPAIITVTMTGCFLTAVHALVGTPNIAKTVAPALIVAFCFNVFTTFKISRAATSKPDS